MALVRVGEAEQAIQSQPSSSEDLREAQEAQLLVHGSYGTKVRDHSTVGFCSMGDVLTRDAVRLWLFKRLSICHAWFVWHHSG